MDLNVIARRVAALGDEDMKALQRERDERERKLKGIGDTVRNHDKRKQDAHDKIKRRNGEIFDPPQRTQDWEGKNVIVYGIYEYGGKLYGVRQDNGEDVMLE